MVRKSSQRHASPRNPIPHAQANGKAEGDDASSNGDGEISGIRFETPANDAGQGKKLSYESLVVLVNNHNGGYRKDYIARAWYPKINAWIMTNGCDVHVLDGEASYQLSTGEIIKL